MIVKHKTVLQRMDALVCWSKPSDGAQQGIARDDGGRYQPMRWLPLLPITFAASLILSASVSTLPYALYGVAGPIIAAAAGIALYGPLGKPSIDDDEREAALRKNAFLFCLALLAFLNIVGGPILLLTAALQGWTSERMVGVAFALFMANMTWFVSFPTLYASWK
jgi:hypothetical protein